MNCATGLKQPIRKMRSAVRRAHKRIQYGTGRTQKEQCTFFTGLCAWKIAEIVCRECGIKNLDEVDKPCERRALADIV